jgi:cysteine desulfurase
MYRSEPFAASTYFTVTGGAPVATAASSSRPSYIYFDNAASTPVTREVIDAMIPVFMDSFANPEATHAAGVDARTLMETHRAQIAHALRVLPTEIFFTSGSSESINLFVRGVTKSNCGASRRRKIVMSTIEHKAVSATCYDMVGDGYEVVEVPVLPATGILDLDALRAAVAGNETLLVCVIMANNEVGVVQPMKQIADIVHAAGALLFSDTTQLAGKFALYPQELGIDAMPLSGHKIHGPKGIGALYMSSAGATECTPIITGGSQERGQRAGTSNTPGIAGLATAVVNNLSPRGMQLQRDVGTRRDWIETQLMRANRYVKIHGARAPRVNYISSVSLFDDSGAPLDKFDTMSYLSDNGVIVNTGSACNGGADRSEVLAALGLSDADARCTIRISLGTQNTWQECEELVRLLYTLLKQGRRLNRQRE